MPLDPAKHVHTALQNYHNVNKLSVYVSMHAVAHALAGMYNDCSSFCYMIRNGWGLSQYTSYG